MCSVASFSLNPAVPRDFEMEAKSDKDGRQHRALNKRPARVFPCTIQAFPCKLSLFFPE